MRIERRAVDARQLLQRRVAAPVRAGEPGELQRLDRLRVLEVRAATEVGEVTLRVQRDVALGGVDELDLVRLALGGEARLRLVAGDLLARPLAALLQLALDLRLDLLEVVLVDRLRKLEVVVEAVLDRRADRDLHARVEPPDRLGEQVRGRVAQHVQRVRVVPVARRQDLDAFAVLERQAQILDAAVRTDEHRLLGELRPDRARGVEAGRAVGELELGVVGQDDPHRGPRICTAARPVAGMRSSRPCATRAPAPRRRVEIMRSRTPPRGRRPGP